jgi:hypothetical protein
MTSEPLARLEDAALLTGRGQFLDDLSPLPGSGTSASAGRAGPRASRP